MEQIRPLTREQLAYARKYYLAGWGIERLAARLPGIGKASLKHHLWATGVTLRQPGGHPKMPTFLPPPFKASDFHLPPPDAQAVKAWDRVILPGWRVHGEIR